MTCQTNPLSSISSFVQGVRGCGGIFRPVYFEKGNFPWLAGGESVFIAFAVDVGGVDV